MMLYMIKMATFFMKTILTIYIYYIYTFFKVVARATVGKFGRIWQPTGHNFEPCV